MLKHELLRRQGWTRNSLPPGVVVRHLAPHPGVAHVDPGVLVLPEPQPAGYPRRKVHTGGVENLPAELIPAPVVVVEVGNLGFGLAAREIVPHVPIPAALPIVVPDVPRPHLLDPDASPVVPAAQADPETPVELQLFVRQGYLVRGVAMVLGGEDPAPYTSGRSEEHTSELQSRQYLVC